jgi:hypothetical protein
MECASRQPDGRAVPRESGCKRAVARERSHNVERAQITMGSHRHSLACARRTLPQRAPTKNSRRPLLHVSRQIKSCSRPGLTERTKARPAAIRSRCLGFRGGRAEAARLHKCAVAARPWEAIFREHVATSSQQSDGIVWLRRRKCMGRNNCTSHSTSYPEPCKSTQLQLHHRPRMPMILVNKHYQPAYLDCYARRS